MSIAIFEPASTSKRIVHEIVVWARQMRVALGHAHYAATCGNPACISAAVDRHMTGLRLRGIDPRL